MATLEADTGNALQEAVEAFERVGKAAENAVNVEEVVDFEHLNIKDELVEEEDDDELSKVQGKELTPEERKRIKDKQRKKILVKRQKQEQHRLHQHKKVREEGQPFQTTVKAPVAGWYRFCVMGSFHQVSQKINE